MSAVWDSMLAAEAVDMDQIRTDHGMAQAVSETVAWRASEYSYGVSYKQGYRNGWWHAVAWILQEQARFGELTEAEALTELRKGTGSIHAPWLREIGWVLRFDCPTCGHQVTVDKRGICDTCTFEFGE